MGAGDLSSALLLALIHRSAWKANSQESVYRLLHSPVHWTLYGRPETSLLLKVDHYMLHVRIKMRSGGCVAFSQNTDTDTGVGVVRCSRGWSIMGGPACLNSVCVQGDLKAVIDGEARRVVEEVFIGYNSL
jgi:hypothetical protein